MAVVITSAGRACIPTVYSSCATVISVIPRRNFMPVVKKAPAKKSQRRIALTVRLASATLKNIEKLAPKSEGSRTFIRKHLEQTFGL
jgi:hypothetical protein